jgi:hypothetical protein
MLPTIYLKAQAMKNFKQTAQPRWIDAILILVFIAIVSPSLTYGANHSAEVINVCQLGACGTDQVDDTEALQQAVDLAANNGYSIFLPAGTYFLIPQGTRSGTHWRNISYALLLEHKQHIDIRFTGPGTIAIPISDDTPCNAIMFNDCSDVSVSGIKIFPSGSAPKLKRLYSGYAAVFMKCTRFSAKNIHSTNVAGSALAFESTRGEISHSISSTKYVGLRGMHFGSLGSSFVTISDCRAEGGTGDGDIFHFGSGQWNRIVNCEAINVAPHGKERFLTAQGIGIDSGQRFSTIENCYVKGYYYGIDVKTNTTATKIIGNRLASNKIGIAVRRGEGNAPTNQTEVKNNKIYPEHGNGAPTLPNRIATIGAAWGVFLQDALGCTVSDNYIGFDESNAVGIYRWTGITVWLTSATSRGGNNNCDISGNTIELETQSAKQHAITFGPAISLVGGSEITIEGNAIAVSSEANHAAPIVARNLKSLTLTDNSFSGATKANYLNSRQVSTTSSHGNSFR